MKHDNFFPLMAAHKPHGELWNAIATATPEQIKEWAAEVNDNMLAYVLSFLDETIRAWGVADVLITGGYLEIAWILLEPDHRKELYDALLEDVGISRTQSFRNRAVWRCFGATLHAEPKLKSRFCRESLKRCSEERVPPEARDEVLKLAREGEKITIKRAERLLAHYGVIPDPPPPANSEPAAAPVRRPRKRPPKANTWLFVGSAARIKVIPTAAQDLTDVDAVIRDLEAAIAQLRNRGTAQQVA